MTIEQYLNRLCRNILNERFDWRKYLTTQAYSAETFASLRSMSPMGKLAIPSISLTLVTLCLNSHTIGK